MTIKLFLDEQAAIFDGPWPVFGPHWPGPAWPVLLALSSSLFFLCDLLVFCLHFLFMKYCQVHISIMSAKGTVGWDSFRVKG